jgi:hypothetical protein
MLFFRFGKPHIIDISDADQGKALDKAREIYNEIYDGLWDDLMDRSLLDFEKYETLTLFLTLYPLILMNETWSTDYEIVLTTQ